MKSHVKVTDVSLLNIEPEQWDPDCKGLSTDPEQDLFYEGPEKVTLRHIQPRLGRGARGPGPEIVNPKQTAQTARPRTCC